MENTIETGKEKKKGLNLKEIRKTLNIFRFILPYKYYFFIGMVFLLFTSVTAVAFPYVIGELVDAANVSATGIKMGDIKKYGLFLAAALFFQAIFSFLRIYFFSIVSEKGMADVRTSLYQKIIGLPLEFFEMRRVGELTSRISSDVTQLQTAFSTTLAQFFRQVSLPLLCIPLIAIISGKLTLIMLATYPLMIILAIFFGRFIRKLSKRSQDALAEANTIVEETLQSISMVKAFTNEVFESVRYNRSIAEVVTFALRAAKFRGAFVSFVIFAIIGGVMLIIWFGTIQISQGLMTTGELVQFLVYTLFIGSAIGGLGETYATLQKTIGASERIQEILDDKSELTVDGTDPKQSEKLIGNIEFNHITFAYPTRMDINVLKDLSLKIEAGQKVALVGQSGAGKSTIISILLGFYPLEQGTIKVDGKTIEQLGLTTLRNNIGIVPQEVILFGGTIKENIAYGKPNAGDDEILTAAGKANAMEFIKTFPEGLDTVVGERGVKLSGGQKQRIAIARAILKDPKILVLDEATSSLDAASEKLVQEALDELMKNRTTIIIAHRLSTIRKVDRILVISNGQIIESGKHDELSELENGIYRNLLKIQFELN